MESSPAIVTYLLALCIPLHKAVVRGLKPGGVFVLEAFSKEQPAYDTGEPQSPDMLMSLDELKRGWPVWNLSTQYN